MFLFLPAIERDAFHVFADPHQRVAKIRLHPLLTEAEDRKRPPHKVGQCCADQRVAQRNPYHVAGDRDAERFDRPRQSPQDADKTAKRDDIRQQIEGKRQGHLREIAQILGYALIRVVGSDRRPINRQADVIVGPIG